MNPSSDVKRSSIRIGFVSTRFGGTDGVSLETRKWVEVLERRGHLCFFMAGISDWSDDRSHIVDLAHFAHPEIKHIYNLSFSTPTRPRELTSEIHKIKEKLKMS